MRAQRRYAWYGLLLGLGAPTGSMALRLLASSQSTILQAFVQEWSTGSYYYFYMGIGTTIVFSLFGYVVGSYNEELRDLSITDGLTGLFNHRYMQEHLDHEVRRADRYGTRLTCLMIDIDDFKTVNDRCGHLFGDTVLRSIAHQIRNTVRTTDMTGRYGGEEFLVIMPETGIDAAFPLAERILAAVATPTFRTNGSEFHVSVSIGLAAYPMPDHGVKSKNGVLSAADQALYAAKRAGKNRAVVWKP
jgi:diguanylate cyclase (GGDEF)-like protein